MNQLSAPETRKICISDAPDVVGLKAVCEALDQTQKFPDSLKKTGTAVSGCG